MAIKEFLNKTDFSTPSEARDLYGNAVRKSLNFSQFDTENVFEAIVLSAPLFLIDGDLSAGRVAKKTETTDGKPAKMSKFAFKARIITDPSPHATKVINLHTTFISPDDYSRASNTLPKIGDVVFVELDDNIFSYNLQYGKFLSLKTAASLADQGLLAAGAECKSSMRDFYSGPVVTTGVGGLVGSAATFGACDKTYTGPATTKIAGTTRTAAGINKAYPQIAAVSGWAEKIIEVCKELGIPDAAWLANVMYYETGQSLKPSETNSIGCAGLIQFCPKTGAKVVGKTPKELSLMGAVEQMTYVKKYLAASNPGNVYNAPVDLYMTIFFPAGINRPKCLFPDWAIKANNGIFSPEEYARRADKAARIKIF
jgi:hypothetical protein